MTGKRSSKRDPAGAGSPRTITVRGATQNNLAAVDVDLGPGLTAVVGVSGSGKSSLAFDTVYHEARRRFLETMALGAAAARLRPAAVRAIDGLGPAVSIAQNVVNRNPNSTVATALGVHPFLRILFARFAAVGCPSCATPVRAHTDEERLVEARTLSGAVQVPLVRGVTGSHARLLTLLGAEVGRAAIEVDGRRWNGRPLDPDAAHDIVITTGTLAPNTPARDVRAALAAADAWGSPEVVIGGRSLLRAPVCPGCGRWVPPLPATAFRPEQMAADPDRTASHTIAGRTLPEVLSFTASAVMAFLGGADVGPAARRAVDEVTRRLRPLVSLGLDHLALDRPMPTLSRGESQRVRLAVVVAGRLEDLLHVLDEPSIGLHRRDMQALFKVLADLPGPVVMVEHDAAAVAQADDVVELGPAAGPNGGHLVFQGTPAALWQAGTASGRFFSGREPAIPPRAGSTTRGAGAPADRHRTPVTHYLAVTGATARNLHAVDCRFPVGRLTAVTGPSGAGKTTLVRDVVLASAAAGQPAGCQAFDGPVTRALAVDQSPLGNNPRSNPATYTKAFDRIRNLFAKATGQSPSLFTFNRPEGACPTCEGMGAIELTLRYIASTWVTCDTCDGTRYRPEALEHRPRLGATTLSIADALALSVDEAREVFAADRPARRILDALHDVGLGYLQLGQPSPTLSGGEAQRVRLASQLARARAGDLVVLDEPTTGLHPADLSRLAGVLDGLTAAGCTVIVVEHQPDLIAAADWIVELGPGGGPDGGRLQHCGPPAKRAGVAATRPPAPRRQPRRRARGSPTISIRGAAANNLRSVDVDIPKGRFTVVTGVSGSGKSSLVRDVLEAEAMRRLLESLSMYERQAAREGPEAPVRSVTGLGPTLVLGSERRFASGYSEGLNRPTATVGWASDLSRLLAIIVARAGDRACLECGGAVTRTSEVPGTPWTCTACAATAVPIEPRHLNAQSPIAACPRCVGLGAIRRGEVSRLIVEPSEPLCGRAMHSPGYFPRGYLCSEGTGGHAALQALAARHGFDPCTTPWEAMSPEAQRAFLWGDEVPLDVEYNGRFRRQRWRGVMSELTVWDQGGRYTTGHVCPQCHGKRLRPEYLAITYGGYDRTELHAMPLADLAGVLNGGPCTDGVAEESRAAAAARVGFLTQVGLGYIHLDRMTATLSAGEAQRVKLASILGGGLLGMTVLLDEPSRGLHQREVGALAGALEQLRDAGNTVIAVEHDRGLIARADHVVEIGPGPGRHGGRVVYQGPLAARRQGATADALAATPPFGGGDRGSRRAPAGWMAVVGARHHNLRIDRVELPLGVLAGVCGVSGSGKSTLMVDIVGRALAPPKLTSSTATVPLEPGEHDAIEGAPVRTVVADQARGGIHSPGHHLGLIPALRKAFAAADDAVTAGITEADFGAGCDACTGGQVIENMGFLPAVTRACDACDGTGYRAEVRALTARGATLPDTEAFTLDELARAWGDLPAIGRACDAARRLGLGYLVVRQPSAALSGGEVQRLKLARELAKRTTAPTLYLLDEPTVGLHASDVRTLAGALDEVVAAGHSVIVVDHDPALLAHCDWLVEVGPGAGPYGGQIIASGPPEEVARLDTPTAPYLRAVLHGASVEPAGVAG